MSPISTSAGVTCRICGSARAARWGENKGVPLHRCPDCGVVQIDAAHVPAGEHYSAASHYVAADEGFIQAKRANARRMLSLLGRYIAPGRLLEIGCSSGEFLVEARDAGWDEEGLELSEPAAKEARDRYQLHVEQATLAESSAAHDEHDAVVMLHVLEHFDDPAAMLGQVRGALKPDGVLLAAVPNMASLWVRLEGQQWDWLNAPEHVFSFGPRSLAAVLTRADFETLYLRSSAAWEPNLLDKWLRQTYRRWRPAAARHDPPPGGERSSDACTAGASASPRRSLASRVVGMASGLAWLMLKPVCRLHPLGSELVAVARPAPTEDAAVE